MKCCTRLGYLVVFILTLTTANAASSFVPDICRKISVAQRNIVSYTFCVAALAADPQSSVATAPQLGEISFRLSISKAQVIAITINKLLKSTSPNAQAMLTWKKCSVDYSTVSGNLETGLKALKGGNYATAKGMATDAISAAIKCRLEILNKVDVRPDLLKDIRDFHQLGAISLGFAKLLPSLN